SHSALHSFPTRRSSDLGVVVPVDRGDDATHARLAAPQVLAQADNAIIAGRLDRHAADARDVLGDGIEDTDRQSPWQAAGQLPRTENPREGGRRGVRISARELGGASDAPRVHQAFASTAVVDRSAVHVESKDAGTLHEERALLLEGGLERREV